MQMVVSCIFLLFKVGASLPYLTLLSYMRLQSSTAICTTDLKDIFLKAPFITYVYPITNSLGFFHNSGGG